MNKLLIPIIFMILTTSIVMELEKVPEPKIDYYHKVVRYYSRIYGIDFKLVESIISCESGWNKEAISTSGAVGLMQLQPLTAKQLSVNPSVPEENILGGIKYLR